MLKIGDFFISDNNPPIIIAEIGINHCGSLDLAKKMASLAIENGAHIIKHQTHIPSEEMSEIEAKKVIPSNSTKSIWDVISANSLKLSDEEKLKQFVEDNGGTYLSTPFSKSAFEFLESINVVGYKIGSGESENLNFLKLVSSSKKPMIVSTGMQDIENVKNIYQTLINNVNFAILHTTNLYPTPDHLVRLGALTELKEKFPDIQIGLSDHTIGNYASYAAIALGANIIERHFTDTKTRQGPDIINSMDPTELSELSIISERIWKMRGGGKTKIHEEQNTRDFAFGSVVALQDIEPGDLFTTKNIGIKRPGTGDFNANSYSYLIGKKCLIKISKDAFLKNNSICYE